MKSGIRKMIILSAILLVVLTACGNGQSVGAAPQASYTPSAKNTPFPSAPSTSQPLSFDFNQTNQSQQVGNILLNVMGARDYFIDFGIHDQVRKLSNEGIDCKRWLSLKDTTSFSLDERASLDQIIRNTSIYLPSQPIYASIPPNLTAKVEWVPGAAPIDFDFTQDPNNPQPLKQCTGVFNIVNTGSKDIQLEQVGVKLLDDSMTNAYQYHLYNPCTSQSPTNFCTVPMLSRVGDCGYTTKILLHSAKKEDELTGKFYNHTLNTYSGPTCPPQILLKTGEQIDITVTFTMSNSDPGAIFHVVPVIYYTNAQGGQKAVFDTIPSTLIFANNAQFNCYQFNTGSLIQIPGGIQVVADASDQYYTINCV